MRIYEIYRSIQGESSFTGLPCTFIRTAGCSLRCVYCDTAYALPHNAGQEMELERILHQVKNLGVDLVELTGGDPMEQTETPELCRMLLKEGATVLIETGGHVPVNTLPSGVIKILDIKTPGSRMTKKYHWENLNALNPQDEIKFVICDRADFDWSVSTCHEYHLWNQNIIHFSPCFGELTESELANWILDEGIAVRLQLQAHKYIWDPQATGV